ncbi:hypothetical protein [Lactiplantibacillus pentosus]|uniref:hypothetical protein n=1 Tax=Lactiplantibacillus pentosus TaxID=1589 RepID=UPI00193425AD|nr:hypothetical protein [Lactiplantibacillus pentosus]
MTNSELMEQAKNLSAARDNLKMAIDYLDMVSASVNQGNVWAGRLFFADHRQDDYFSQTTARTIIFRRPPR